MAKVTIREYEHTTATSRGIVSVGEEPAVAIQKGSLPFTSSPLNARTKLIRISVDAAAAFDIGVIPLADASSPDLAEGQTEYFGVQQGAGHSVNVVAA